jgi:hypothetical protein
MRPIPTPATLPLDLATIYKDCGLTTYGIGRLVGTETDEGPNTIHKRWDRWLRAEPETLTKIKQDLEVLGYEIRVFKRSENVN